MADLTRDKILSRRGFFGISALVGTFMLAGCGASGASVGSADGAEETAETAEGSSGEAAGAETSPASPVLVAYYSATGNTKRVAEDIASDLGADLFEIEPVKPYTEEELDWTDDSSRVNAEHDDSSQRDVELVQETPDGFSAYTTVFVGYPIWWGGAAWPVDRFVTGNDFNGKTVYPFCTSASSGIGTSAADLAEMCGTGEWQEGRRFPSSATADEVKEWVDALDIEA